MAFIIPNKLLETLTCDSCHKYLSVKPIKVFPNGGIKCGRCCRSENQSDGVVSLYEAIAEKCLFKCINRFDGCRTLLTYSQVENHEKTCLSKQYRCPVCPGFMEIQTFLMGKHFRENHKSLLLDKPGFFLKVDAPVESPVVYFYQKADSVFFLFVNINQADKEIESSFFYLGDSSEAKNVYQQFTVSNGYDLGIEMKPKPCYAYLSTDYEYVSISVPNGTFSVFITFSIIFKDEKLIKLSEGPSLSSIFEQKPAITVSSKTIVPIEINFPMVKESGPFCLVDYRYSIGPSDVTPNKFYSSIFFRLINYKLNPIYFKNCYNCKNICCTIYDINNFYYVVYWNKIEKVSICYHCFHFLYNIKKINVSDYTCVKLDTSYFSTLEIICELCKRYFGISIWKHIDECKLQSLKVCPELNCNFVGTLAEINTHLNIHKYCGETFSCSSLIISKISNVNSKKYFYFKEGFVSLNVAVKNYCKLYLKIQMVPLCEGNRDYEKWKPVALLFDQRDQFLTYFEDSLITNCPDKYYNIKVIVTEVQS